MSEAYTNFLLIYTDAAGHQQIIGSSTSKIAIEARKDSVGVTLTDKAGSHTLIPWHKIAEFTYKDPEF